MTTTPKGNWRDRIEVFACSMIGVVISYFLIAFFESMENHSHLTPLGFFVMSLLVPFCFWLSFLSPDDAWQA